VQVRSLIDEELDHFEVVLVDCIVDGSLRLGVGVVERCPHVNEHLSRLDVAFAHCIVNRCLPVLVLAVNRIATLIAEVLDGLMVALPRSVEEWRLLESVFLGRVDSQLDKNLDHLEGQLVVGDNARRENRRLTEIFGLILEVGHINV